MNPEWVITGIILLGGMAAGGVSMYLKRRRERINTFEAGPESNEGEQEKSNSE